MAKMHTRRKGKSGSTRPIRTEVPEWSNTNKEEIMEVIRTQWKEGKSTSEIGMVLRDAYGVPNTKLLMGKKITQILKEEGEESPVPEDLYNLIIKAIGVRKHIVANKKDVHNKRSLHLVEAKIRRLVKYYQASKVLPLDWKYKSETAEMLIRR